MSNTIINDIENVQVKEPEIDLNKLAALKSKMQNQESKMPKVSKKERSWNFGVVGCGQAGSRIAECFYKLGYNTIAINTALQDLKFIEIPDTNKLLLNYGSGGASKDLSIGEAAAEMHRGLITDLVKSKLSDTEVFVVCSSLGGGSGAGSIPVVVDVLSQFGIPIIVLAALPMNSEDPQTKSNTIETLAKLATLVQNKVVANLITCDNAHIETMLADVNQLEFFGEANKAIVSPLDAFNCFSNMPSPVKPLDSTEFGKLLLDGEGLSIYGSLTVSDYMGDTALSEAIITSLDGNLLASGFDLKKAKYVGVIMAANKKVFSKIPKASTTYAHHIIQEKCGTPQAIFNGTYVTDDEEDAIKVYTFFSGLSLPEIRVSELKEEVTSHKKIIQSKSEHRNISLNIDLGKSDAVSTAQQVKAKIAAKNSNFGKLMGNVIDRRK